MPEMTEVCSNEQERSCNEPWHIDDSVPYCDRCGRYRASVQSTHMTPKEAGQWGREIFERAKAAVDARRIVTLLRAEDPDTPWTGRNGLFQKAASEIERLRAALGEVAELIEGYADADHNGHSFVPNNAMRAQQIIAEALGDLR